MNSSPLHTFMAQLHHKYADLNDGHVADYIPELTRANPDWFGIVLVTVDGNVYSVGDVEQSFTIQSISKAFTYGIALEDKGIEALAHKVNVEPSGEAFNQISLEHRTGRPRNPMINAGAITTVGQVSGSDGKEKIARILEKFSRFAGRPLSIDEAVFQSEKATGHRNRAIAHMLVSSGVLDEPVNDVLDVYFRQCSILVNCQDLAVMAATLANQGMNPLTREQVIAPQYVSKILSVMSSCGMYDGSGSWTYNVGLPAKSGVGGGIIAVLPGKSAIAVFSPRLDEFGNSVRGIKVCETFSDELGLHLFKSERLSDYSIIRASYTLDKMQSKRVRSKKASAILHEQGDKVRIYELTGELGFSAAEVVLARLEKDHQQHDIVIFNMQRVTRVDHAALQLILQLAGLLHEQNRMLILSGAQVHPDFVHQLQKSILSAHLEKSVQLFDDIDHAREWCEDYYLSRAGMPGHIIRTTYLSQQSLLEGLNSAELDFLAMHSKEQHYRKGEYLCHVGDNSNELFFILSGSVSVTLDIESGREQRLATFDAGSAVGEFAVVDKQPRSANILADTDVVCLALNFEKVEQDPSEIAHKVRFIIVENLARSLIERLRNANTEIQALSL